MKDTHVSTYIGRASCKVSELDEFIGMLDAVWSKYGRYDLHTAFQIHHSSLKSSKSNKKLSGNIIGFL